MSTSTEEEMRHPPYQLRTNKSVDRLLLVDLLQSIQPDPGNFNYYSLGGPFLEDLRVIDHFFPHARLCSIESSKQTFSRQEYNRFASTNRLTLKNSTLARFLTNDYEPGERDVFWLDYTQMVSITGVVAARENVEKTKAMVKNVRFVDFDSSAEPHEINIPALTPKERHRLEHLLPVAVNEDAGDVLFDELKYFIDNGEAATKRTLRQYADYYREYPNFVRSY